MGREGLTARHHPTRLRFHRHLNRTHLCVFHSHALIYLPVLSAPKFHYLATRCASSALRASCRVFCHLPPCNHGTDQ
jgi:hypothetical protein